MIEHIGWVCRKNSQQYYKGACTDQHKNMDLATGKLNSGIVTYVLKTPPCDAGIY